MCPIDVNWYFFVVFLPPELYKDCDDLLLVKIHILKKLLLRGFPVAPNDVPAEWGFFDLDGSSMLLLTISWHFYWCRMGKWPELGHLAASCGRPCWRRIAQHWAVMASTGLSATFFVAPRSGKLRVAPRVKTWHGWQGRMGTIGCA